METGQQTTIKTYLLHLEFAFLGLDSLVDVVVLHADATQGCAHLFVLFVAELPGRDDIVGLQESVAGHESVLSAPIVVPKGHSNSNL